MHNDDLADRLSRVLDTAVHDLRSLSGGNVAEVYQADTADLGRIAVKVDRSDRPRLDVEGWMLRYPARKSDLPLPAVHHAEPDLLVSAFMPGHSRFSAAAERHAADLLADLHTVTADAYGLPTADHPAGRETLIGGLPQPNPTTDKWTDFFVDHRLRYMAAVARDAGRLPPAYIDRIDSLCARLPNILPEPDRPALLHGDVWTTNVLATDDRITAFLDPAVYYGHPEIELAFITLFGTFSDAFFDRYGDHRPIARGFFEERRDLYNLYPLLVHVRLFGGGYVQSVDRILRRFGV